MIAVVIPTLNRARLLAASLDALAHQTIDTSDHVVVVVDNGSTDDTEQVVSAAAKEMPNLDYVREDRPGLHMARHRGADACDADLLLFGDDDMRAAPTWVEAVARAFEDPAVGVVGGPCRPDFEATPPGWVDELWLPVEGGRMLPEWSVAELERKAGPIDPGMVWGCNFGVRRSVLEEVGGFHPDGFPAPHEAYRGDGETHVAMAAAQAGWGVHFEPDAAVDHLVSADRLTLDYVRRRGFRGGVSTSFRAFRTTGTTDRIPTRGTLRMLRLLVDRGGARELAYRHFARGWFWHQHRLRRDADLRAWALQESYWGDQGLVPALRA